MKTVKFSVNCLGVVALVLSCFYPAWGATVSYDAHALIINGQRRIILSGAIHYARSSPEMWPGLIQKAKEGGLDAIETYVFWNLHEPKKRQYDFTGQGDIIKFFKLVQQAGLYGILRIGPYVCAEWNYGGFPLWLHTIPGIQLRTNDETFKGEMQTFTTKIVSMFKAAQLFAPQGGPIILAQIENEYGNVMEPYGVMGNMYLQWCAQFAQSLNIGVPWIMCQQHNAPKPMIDTCNGHYCDTFTPNDPKNPKMWTENWVGWYTKWGDSTPHRPAEDVAYAVARFFQSGGILQNYYMYHGGTNFGRTSGGPYITTSYDYDAPLNEYGMLNQPKWGHLKNLHAALKIGESHLTTGNATTTKLPNGVTMTTYTNTTGGKFCFLSNPSEDQTAHADLVQNGQYTLPPWSVSILQGCNFEVFNTAKVTAQTSIVDYNPATVNTAYAVLSWSWTAEPKMHPAKGNAGTFNASKLLDQKDAAADGSDYLWYMTSVDINDSSWSTATIKVNTSGHVLRGYLNDQDLGVEWGKSGEGFLYQRPVNLKPGKNNLTFLSSTVGFANYGAFFDLVHTGIAGGPVQLINSDSTIGTMDLSSNTWFYTVGLNGESAHLYNPQTQTQAVWKSVEVPLSSPMTWYKANFLPPAGTDPVVLDLQGMRKGRAWVNNVCIGRYWVGFNASGTCTGTCKYQGQYTPNKCLMNCGQPTQRFYHVPRSVLSPGKNTLVLFEELGGDPTKVNFQTAVVTTVCGIIPQGGTMDLSCPTGHTISDVKFASYGNPQGSCSDFSKGTCEAANAMSVVQEACTGKQMCSLVASNDKLGPSGCISTIPSLAVQVMCR